MSGWQVAYSAPIPLIHAALLHTGKVLFFAGSGNNPATVGTTNDSVILDLASGTFVRPTTPRDANGVPIDTFCAGQAFLPDGTVLVAGGTLQYDPFKGLTSALLFDPVAQRWVHMASMNGGHWYPTAILMGYGRVLVFSGLNTTGGLNTQPEQSPASSTGGWDIYPPTTSPLPMYAHLFLLSNGKLFFSGGAMGSNHGVSPRLLSVPSNSTQRLTEVPVPGLAAPDASDQATSVLLPPAQDQRVMIAGGSNGMAVNRVAITSNLTAANPTYTTAPPLTHARMHLSAVLLPDRTVFVCNGSGMNEDESKSRLPAEIYHPQTNTWTVVESPTVPRVYHSMALLLPDGRVLTAGGNPKRGVNELRIEIYSPTYMSKTRPVIEGAPSSTTYGSTLVVGYRPGPNIKWAQLVRPSATTHSCDTEQRLVDLPIISRNANSTLSLAVTSNRNLAPPGWYMLFLTDTANVPSTAAWIHLS